jgi:hypothetical protein
MPPKKKVRRYPQKHLTEVDEGRHYSEGVGNEMYQLQLVVVQKPAEEVARGKIEAMLIGKTRMKFRSASVRISYALLHLREIPRFLSTQGARGLVAFNPTLI